MWKLVTANYRIFHFKFRKGGKKYMPWKRFECGMACGFLGTNVS